jgi:hypothetical protein
VSSKKEWFFLCRMNGGSLQTGEFYEEGTELSTIWAGFPQIIHSSLHHFASKVVDNWVANLGCNQVHFL